MLHHQKLLRKEFFFANGKAFGHISVATFQSYSPAYDLEKASTAGPNFVRSK
jgi:hypothetical protein